MRNVLCRKGLSLLLAGLMTLSSVVTIGAAGNDYTARPVKSVPYETGVTVDGVKDSMYDNGWYTTLDNVLAGTDPNLATAKAWMVHDGEMLYVYADVTDTQMLTVPMQPYVGDDVHMYLDGFRFGVTGYDNRYTEIFIYANGETTYYEEKDGVTFYGYSKATGITATADSFLRGKAITPTVGGYAVEFAVDLDSVGLQIDIPFGYYMHLEDFNADRHVGSRDARQEWDAVLETRSSDAITTPDTSTTVDYIPYRPDNGIFIDGAKDEMYQSGYQIEVGTPREDMAGANATAHMYMVHDGEYLYVYADVSDGDMVTPSNPDDQYDAPWKCDALEFIVRDAFTYNAFQTIVDVDGYGTYVLNDNYTFKYSGLEGVEDKYKDGIVSADQTGDGYTVEFALKMSDFCIFPGYDTYFQAQVDDLMHTEDGGLTNGFSTINGKGSWDLDNYVAVPVEEGGDLVSPYDKPIEGTVPFVEFVDVDGQFDESYQSEPNVYIGTQRLGFQAGEATANAWLAHDGEYLYVYTEVNDPNVFEANPDREIWECDAIEFIIENSNGDAYLTAINTASVASYVKNDNYGDVRYNLDGVEHKYGNRVVRMTDDGYVVEFALKMSEFGIVPGHNLVFQMQVDDEMSDGNYGYNTINGKGSWDRAYFTRTNLEYGVKEPEPSEPGEHADQILVVDGIQVDGNLDDKYLSSYQIDVGTTRNGFEPENSTNDLPLMDSPATAKVYMVHDGTYLYVYADVTDPDVLNLNELDPDYSDRRDNYWKYDGIEFITKTRGGEGSHQTIVDASGYATKGFHFFEDGHEEFNPNLEGVEYMYDGISTQITDKGYAVEMALKMRDFDIWPGSPTSFQIQVNDVAGSDNGLVYGYNTVNGGGTWESENYTWVGVEYCEVTNDSNIIYKDPLYIWGADVGVVNMDGHKEELWYEGAYYTEVNTPVDGSEVGDASARAFMIHDGKYLYLYAEVTDDQVVLHPEDQPYGNDCVELVIDPQNGSGRHLFSVYANGNVHYNRNGEEVLIGREQAASKFSGAYGAAIDGGYVIEMSVRMDEVGISTDNELLYQIQLVDVDENSENAYTINGNDVGNSDGYIRAWLDGCPDKYRTPFLGDVPSADGINAGDAIKDDQYAGAVVFTTNTPVDGHSEAAATTYMVHDNGTLYLYTEVTDPDMPEQQEGRNPWDSDSITFSVQGYEGVTEISIDRFGYAYFRKPDGTECYGYDENYGQVFAAHGVTEIPGGYAIEMALNYSGLSINNNDMFSCHVRLGDATNDYHSFAAKHLYGLDQYDPNSYARFYLNMDSADTIQYNQNPGVVPNAVKGYMLDGTNDLAESQALILGDFVATEFEDGVPEDYNMVEPTVGNVYLGHNGEYLYVYAEVMDDTVVASHENYARSDNIQFTIDGDGTDGGFAPRLFINRDGTYYMEAINFGEWWHNGECNYYIPAKPVITEIDGGYSVEFVMYLDALDVGVDGNIGIQCQIADDRGNEDADTYYCTLNGRAIYSIEEYDMMRIALAPAASADIRVLPYVNTDQAKISVDGERDEGLYDDALYTRVDQPVHGREGTVTADTWMVHNGVNIYLYAEVNDPGYDPNNEENRNGVLEVAFMNDHDGYTNWMAVYTHGNANWYDTNGDSASGAEGAPCRFAGYAATPTEYGYTIEMALKMYDMGTAPGNYMYNQIYVEEIYNGDEPVYLGATINGAEQGDMSSFEALYIENVYLPNENLGDAPNVSGIVVDGYKDENLYDNAVIAPVGNGNSFVKGEFYVTHDEEYLYVYAEVQDEDLVFPDSDTRWNEPWNTDSVEVFVDSRYNGTYQARVDWHSWPSFFKNNEMLATGATESRVYFKSYKAVEIEGGYAVEMALYLDTLDIDLDRNDNYGVNFQINNRKSNGGWECYNYKWIGSWDAGNYANLRLLRNNADSINYNLGLIPRVAEWYPNMDGQRDEIYDEMAAVYDINVPYMWQNYGDNEVATGKVWTMVRDHQLVVYAEIHDPDPVHPDPELQANAPWETDSLEVIIDGTTRDFDRAVQMRVDVTGYPSVFATDGSEQWYGYGSGAERFINDCRTYRGPNGNWHVEMVLDLYAFNVDAWSGANFGLQFQINDKRSDGAVQYTSLNGEGGMATWAMPRAAMTAQIPSRHLGNIPFNPDMTNIVVDGHRDDMYGVSMHRWIDKAIYDTEVRAPADVEVAHDGNYLYVFAHVHDDEVLDPDYNIANEEPWRTDSFEVIVRSNQIGSSLISQARVNNVGDATAYYFNDGSGVERATDIGDFIVDYAAAPVDGDGYTVEMVLDMAAMQIATGRDLYIQYQINDIRFDGNQLFVSTNGEGAYLFDEYHYAHVDQVDPGNRDWLKDSIPYFTSEHLMIDGVMDGGYDTNRMMIVNQGTEGRDTASAEVYTVHDGQYLYVYAEVTDDDVVTPDSDKQQNEPWMTDSFEVVLNTWHDVNRAMQARVDVSGYQSYYVFNGDCGGVASAYGNKETSRMIPASYVRRTETGYVVEMALDMAWFNINTYEPAAVQFQINNMHTDGSYDRITLNGRECQVIDRYYLTNIDNMNGEPHYWSYLDGQVIDNPETDDGTPIQLDEHLGTVTASPGDVLWFEDVWFEGGENYLSMLVARGDPENDSTISVYVDDMEGEPWAVLYIGYTGGWDVHAYMNQVIEPISRGNHNIYFQFGHCDNVKAVRFKNVGEYHFGNMNDDDTVSALDRTILTRYLEGWDGYSIHARNADLNGDLMVTAKDRMILSRYVAGWKGYEKIPMQQQLN